MLVGFPAAGADGAFFARAAVNGVVLLRMDCALFFVKWEVQPRLPFWVMSNLH